MTTRLLLEGTDLTELVATVREQFGPTARIVSAERVRSGGFAGFFTTEHFEMMVDVPDEAAPPPRAFAHHPPAPAPAPDGDLDALLDAADAADGPARSPDAGGGSTQVSTSSEQFAVVLDQVRSLVGLPVPDVVVPARADVARAATHPVPPAPATAARATAAPATAAPADAAAATVRSPEPPTLRAELVRMGVPDRLLGPGPVTLAAVLRRLPQPPPAPRGAGELLVVAGEGDGPRAVVRSLAVRWALPDERVHELDAAAVVPFPRDARAPQVVALRVGPKPHDRTLAAQALAQLAPDQVWAVTDARTKPADVAAWVAAVGVRHRVDALAVHGLLETAAPGTVLEPGLPVAWVDGVPASRLVWAAALGQELEQALG
ncbi:MAG: hypothetical protein IR158_15555 [Cellulomonas sp.]|uniref:hypothetical protein n=1 Tax=Cellulomonas sp. TaxID=40001 RepID=UPI0019D9DCB8|nr:hypothetical protein [Cellulomonas sp.]MBF0689169.1 hypothetical protein [Cellulomonas sp.]